MKIRNVNNMEQGPAGLKAPAHLHDNADRGVIFRRTVSGLSEEAQVAQAMAAIEEIDRQGAKLAKRADVKELERYRALIKSFLDQLVSGGFKFTKENSFAARGRHRLFATVNVINQKLEELGRQVLAGQADNIGLLAAADEIRGLIMDMLL